MRGREVFSTTHRAIPILAILSGALIIVATLIIASHPVPVAAEGSDMNLARSAYPSIRGTRLDACSLCHSNTPSLNAYGSDYRRNGRNAGAFAAIEALDSDGDGFTNLQEINALTFHGNANDRPAGVPTATATARPTNTQTPTNTQAPTNTRAPTATATPTSTQSPANTPTPTLTSGPTQAPTNTATAAPTGQPPGSPTPTVQPTETSAPRPTETEPPGGDEVTADADAYVNRSERNRNFGRTNTLRVEGRPSITAFIRFDLGEADADDDVAGSEVEQQRRRIVLRLYATEGSRRGVSVSSAGDDNWNENRITYNSAPDYGGRSVESGSFGSGWVEIDVTSLVRGRGEVTLVLTTNGDAELGFASREVDNRAPHLVFERGGR
jgi:hypothetical protein